MRISRFVVMATLSVVLMVVSSGAALAAPRSGGSTGYDVSYPQCNGALPASPAFGIVGVSDGLAYGTNPCLARQYAWALTAPAGSPPAFYLNTGNPGGGATRVSWYTQTGPRLCDNANPDGCAYDYGYNGAKQAFDYAVSQSSPTAAKTAAWWLDVETANSWVGSSSQNLLDIQGSIEFLTKTAFVSQVGIYSTGYQWGQITGSATLPPTVLNWVAGALNKKGAPALCAPSFSGGRVVLVQYPSGGFDADYVCP